MALYRMKERRNYSQEPDSSYGILLKLLNIYQKKTSLLRKSLDLQQNKMNTQSARLFLFPANCQIKQSAVITPCSS
ncbi:hypothetical protein [Metabacillus fastidiosus]|uniref:hypothetical protein n=1 Tax=Metabacillus fastidiosus TaxID=1458 RepID=UPI003D2ACDA7